MENKHLILTSILSEDASQDKGHLYGYPVVLFTLNNELTHSCIKTSPFLAIDADGIRTFDDIAKEHAHDKIIEMNSLEFNSRRSVFDTLTKEQIREAISNIQNKMGLSIEHLCEQIKPMTVKFKCGSQLPMPVAVRMSEVANKNRDIPFVVMGEVQTLMGSGVMHNIIEHCGDLIHRMTHRAPMGIHNQDIVYDKVTKSLEYLTDTYGFRRQHEEDILSNYRFRKQMAGYIHEWAAFDFDVNAALMKYAKAHSELPAYNKPMLLAKRACVALGVQDFDEAIDALNELKELLESPKNLYAKSLCQFEETESGIKDLTNLNDELFTKVA